MTIVNLGVASTSGGSLSFTNIPQTGKHLILTFSGVPTSNGTFMEVSYNGVTNMNCGTLQMGASIATDNYIGTSVSKVFYQSMTASPPYNGSQLIIPFYADTGTKCFFRDTASYSATITTQGRLGFDFSTTSTAGISSITITTGTSGTYYCSLEMVK